MNHLAINGGPKAIPEPLPSFRDHSGRSLGDEEIAELVDAIRSGALSFLTGKKTAAFERGFADLLGMRDAVAVANGTAALHAAVIYLNPEPGDEIILSPVTDMGTAIPIMAQLAVPVFADVDPATQNITASTIEACLTPRTRAIIVTHVFGAPADMDPIMELAARHGLFVIEDCAQAHLATYKGLRFDRPHRVLQLPAVQAHDHRRRRHGGCQRRPALRPRTAAVRRQGVAAVAGRARPPLPRAQLSHD